MKICRKKEQQIICIRKLLKLEDYIPLVPYIKWYYMALLTFLSVNRLMRIKIFFHLKLDDYHNLV